MNYTQDITPLETAGLTDSQIADVLSSVTVQPIGFQAFNNFTYEQGLAARHPISGEWQGTLPGIAEADGHPLQSGVSGLYSHLNKPQSIQIDTSIYDVNDLIETGRFVNGEFERQPWCIMAAQLLTGLVAMQVITPEHREGFYALGGGLKHGTVTVEQIEELRTQYVFQSRVTNATALFSERMTADGDAAAVMAQAWEDAE